MDSNRSYFMRRAAQERSAAERADGAAKTAHQELERRYRKLVGGKAGAVQQPADSPTA